MGKIKKTIAALILFLAFCLTACSGDAPADKSDSKKTAQVQTAQADEEKEEQAAGKIPGELLPSGRQEGEEQKDSDGVEITGESGAVYASGKTESTTNEKTGSGSKQNAAESSGAEKNDGSQDSKGTIEVEFSIESSKADGSVSYAASMTLDAGATVYDALAASGISHSGKSYISAIGGLSEGMFGKQSGWKYYVNGSAPGKSCASYTLQNGDNVQWSYVLTP